jgi:hypothetical protein
MQALKVGLAACLLGSGLVMAQLLPESPDWRESEVPPPPAFDLKRLIRVPGPDGSSLKFGIDPETVAVTPEGIVRYVIVASSPDGGRNVMYEGIRCSAGQYRLYARHNESGGWTALKEGEWQPLYGSPASRHALTLSLAGVCKDRAVNRTAANIVRTLKSELPGGYD